VGRFSEYAKLLVEDEACPRELLDDGILGAILRVLAQASHDTVLPKLPSATQRRGHRPHQEGEGAARRFQAKEARLELHAAEVQDVSNRLPGLAGELGEDDFTASNRRLKAVHDARLSSGSVAATASTS